MVTITTLTMVENGQFILVNNGTLILVDNGQQWLRMATVITADNDHQ